MAEFGINATQLSAPQGAGSSVVQPVAPVDYTQTIKNLGSIFVNGVKQYKENQAQAAEQAVVGSFSREMGALNQALASGQLKPDVHAMRARALSNQYLASNSQYSKQLQEVYRGFQSATELGSSIDVEKAARDQKNALIRDAQQSGRIIDSSWMSEQAIDSEIKSYQSSVRITKEWERQRAENAEKRAQGEYDIKMEARENEKASLQLITNLADNEMPAFTKFAAELSDKVKSGMTQELATFKLNERYTQVKAGVLAAAGLNKEMAGPYQGLFRETYEAALKFIDPKTNSEDTANFLKTLEDKAKIGLYLGDAKLFQTAMISKVLGNHPSLALNSNLAVSRALVNGVKDASGNDLFLSIVGSPEAKEYFAKINEANKLNAASAARSPQSDAEVRNLYNNAVNGIVDHASIPRMGAKELSASAEFLSSTGFGEQVKAGTVPAEKMAEMANVFQAKYVSTIRELVSKRLNEPLKAVSFDSPGYSTKDGKIVRNKPPENANIPVKDAINVSFTGGGIGFSLKDNKSLDSKQLNIATGILKELSDTKRAVDQIIRIGAHIEGTTDYSGFFEKNKHILLPDLFKAPEAAKGDSKVSFKTEADMKAAATFSPEEIAAQRIKEANPATIAANKAELQKELSRKNISPEIKAILETELAKLK